MMEDSETFKPENRPRPRVRDFQASLLHFAGDALQFIIYTLLLVLSCLYFFKWINEQRRPLGGANNILIEGDVPRGTTADGALRSQNDIVLRQIDGPRERISSLIFLADGKLIACACVAQKTIRIVNIGDYEEKAVSVQLDIAVNVITASKDGESLVTGDVDGKVAVLDMDLKKTCEAAERHGRMITALDVSESHFASGSNDGTVVIWAIGSQAGFLLPTRRPLIYHSQTSVSCVKFSPSGNHIASSSSNWACSVKIWHARTGDLIAAIPAPNGLPTHSLAWSNDGQQLFAGSYGGSISCFDTVKSKYFSKVVKPRPGDDSITSLRVYTNGQLLISFSAPAQTVDIWDIRDTPAREPLHSYSGCVSVSLSLDGRYLASSGLKNDTKISIRCITGVVGESFLFHRFASSRHSEPFTYISPTAYQAWKSGELKHVESILSREIEDERYPNFVCHARGNRALIRARLGNVNGALHDADNAMENGSEMQPMACVAKTMILIQQRKRREETHAFESDCRDDVRSMIECVEAIFLFEAELHDKSYHETELTALSPLAETNPHLWVKARQLLILTDHCLQRGEYDEGLRLLSKVPDLRSIPEAKIIPLIFGWGIYDLECMAEQLKCQALFASGRTDEVMDLLRVDKNCLDEENEARKADLGWLVEKFGDEALRHANFDNAIIWYTSSLALSPESRVIDSGSEFAKKCLEAVEAVGHATDDDITEDLALIARYSPGSARLLVKRSRAKAAKRDLHSALEDADQAINTDASCSWGYERKYAALYGLDRYREATEALDNMLARMEESADSVIRQLRANYVMPAQTIKKIDEKINAIRELSPLVLICLRSGRLCDADERRQTFKHDPIFHELVSSLPTKLDTVRIEKVVARYFRYVMFSHTWEGNEPSFQDLSGISVYELDTHPLKVKLRRFCEIARDDPERYLWAWSDTCCIDKTIETVYRKSIRSMYSWYKESALTIVLLAHGSTTLRNNRWMTRAWTLQELLAPKSVRFYNRDWKVYQGDRRPNHKESSSITGELAEVIDVAQDTIVDFSPKSLDIRVKLRLASTREATEKVDIAYALIGIFSSDLIPEYREPEDALGLLLQEITHRERDTRAVLDWVGKSSLFNSCLPAQISAYRYSPFTPPLVPEDETLARIAELRALLPQREVVAFFEKLSSLGRVDFAHRRLSLPCILFSASVDVVKDDDLPSTSGHGVVYRGRAAVLGVFRFETSCAEVSACDEVVVVYPWVRDLLAQSNAQERDDLARGLQAVAHLERPFRALLLVRRSFDTYKRVAAESEILIPSRKITSLEAIRTEVLEIM